MAEPLILFVAEAVSLAHVARPSVLAASVAEQGYQLVLASNGQFPVCSADPRWRSHAINSVAPALFLKRLAAGQPVYSESELRDYVREDIRMLEQLKPQAVVGDYRLSLAVAARQVGVPLLAISNAHWSPYAAVQRMQAPDLAVARLLGFPLLDRVFRSVWPWASMHHCRSINRIRADYGMPPYASLREYYSDADLTLYADAPELVPTVGAPASQQYMGPVVWSPAMARPTWWDHAQRRGRPLVYITLGSTGSVDLLPAIVEACLAEGLACLVATAGRSDFRSYSPDVFTAPYLPGSDAAELASLVICNGGSATAHQALQKGRPVLGICSNLDQVLTMAALQRAGVGLFFRAGQFSASRSRLALRQLRSEAFQARAQSMVQVFQDWNPQRRFPALLARQLGRKLAQP